MKKVFVLALMMWWGNALVQAQSFSLAEGHDLQYRGELFTQQLYFPQAGFSSNMPGLVSTMGLEFDLSYLTPWGLTMKLHPRVAIDPSDLDMERKGALWMGEGRSRIYFEDAYLDYYDLEFVELRAGYQTLNWKQVESYSWTDFINQVDQEVDLFSAEKLPELIVRNRFTLPIELDHTLNLYYIPTFQPGPSPREDNRYDFLSTSGTKYQYLPERMTYSDSLKENRYQFAIKWNSIFLDDIDYSLLYFNGYERLPFYFPVKSPTEASKGVVTAHYEAIEKLGLNFVGELDSWLIKGEVLGNRFQRDVLYFDQGLAAQGDLNPFVRKAFNPWLGYTVGAEYTLYEPIVEGQDLGLILEVIGHNADEDVPLFLPFKNHAFTGLRYTFNNISDRSILLGGFMNYTIIENVLSLEYEERIGQGFRIKAGGFLLAGEESSELSTFESSSRFQTELSYFF